MGINLSSVERVGNMCGYVLSKRENVWAYNYLRLVLRGVGSTYLSSVERVLAW